MYSGPLSSLTPLFLSLGLSLSSLSLRDHHSSGWIRCSLSFKLSWWRVRTICLHWVYWPQSLLQWICTLRTGEDNSEQGTKVQFIWAELTTVYLMERFDDGWFILLLLRYTLTEGDFHHLKKARLTHLHLPPAPCDLKILTIMECDSTESSTINISETTAPKLPLSIYQVTWKWSGRFYAADLNIHNLVCFLSVSQRLCNMCRCLSPALWEGSWLDGSEPQWRSARRPSPLHRPGPGTQTSLIHHEDTAHPLPDCEFQLFPHGIENKKHV